MIEATISDDELTKRVEKWVQSLCNSCGNSWVLRVPVDPNTDPDFLFLEATKRMNAYSARIQELEQHIRHLERLI